MKRKRLPYSPHLPYVRNSPLQAERGVVHHADEPLKAKEAIAQVPIDRLGTPDEIAGVTLFLDSNAPRSLRGSSTRGWRKPHSIGLFGLRGNLAFFLLLNTL